MRPTGTSSRLRRQTDVEGWDALRSPVSPGIVWGVGPFLTGDTFGRKRTARLASAVANYGLTALQRGAGPNDRCAFGYKHLQQLIVFRGPWFA
jgi:hypothetical protein